MQRRKRSKEEWDAEAVGRVDTQALRAALEEVLRYVDDRSRRNLCVDMIFNPFPLFDFAWCRAEQAGREAPLGEVAQRYGADEQVLRETLQHCGLVPVEKAADGRLVAARKTFGGGGGGGGGGRGSSEG